MKRKIAVYFSGRCNGYERCVESLKLRFYDKYDCDFFWSIDEESETPYYARFKSLLRPKAVNYEKLEKTIVDVPLASEETRRQNSISMFYHNYVCTQMIAKHAEQNEAKYDAVVKFRAEIDSESEFDIPDSLIENTVYVPHGYNYRGVGDRIAYGTFNSMLVYGSLYLHIHNYVFVKQAIMNPEYLLMFHINENNMNLFRFPYTYRLHPDRHRLCQTHAETQQHGL